MKVNAHNCLTREEKKVILTNHEEDKSYSEIASIVWKPKSVVYRVISRFKADKTFDAKPRTSRPPMTTKHEDRMIVEMSLKDGFDAATFISRIFWEQTGKPINRKTVSRRLNKEKICCSYSMTQTFDFKQKSKGPSWLHYRVHRVDRRTMEYGSL